MPHRYLIAPDPATDGAFYAECIETKMRYPVPGPRITANELRSIVGPCDQLEIPGTTMVLVEHPTPKKPVLDVHATNDEGKPVCLEPGCLTPAPLYCSEHRYQMTATDF